MIVKVLIPQTKIELWMMKSPSICTKDQDKASINQATLKTRRCRTYTLYLKS